MSIDALIPAEFDCDIDRTTSVITLKDEAVIKAISSETARRVLAVLQESPQPISKIADELEVSIQVVSYHTSRLETVGLVTTVATTYSTKGKEVQIYALATNELVIKFDSCTGRG